MTKQFNSIGKNKFAVKISVSVCVHLWMILLCLSANAQTLAPNAPGKDAQWASAGKQGVGTAANTESKVWFTLAQGALTEVYYPNVTVANVYKLEFVVVNPKTKKVETETEDAIHEIKVTRPDSLTFQQINTAKSGEWKIIKTYVTNPDANSIWIDVKFQTESNSLKLYCYYDPSIKNSGMGDLAHISRATEKTVSTSPKMKSGKRQKEDLEKGKGGTHLLSGEGNIRSLLIFNVETKEATSGFLGTSDGLAQLREKGYLRDLYDSAENGNVVQMIQIVNPKHFSAVLSFGKEFSNPFVDFPARVIKNAGEYLTFETVRARYEKGWSDYVKTLPKVEPKYQAQFNMAAMQLKAHEDKTVRGANIASLTVPWGGGANANENNIGGYHLVWSRDLYQVATAYMALGDDAAAIRALDFLFKVQQKPDGSFPQNSFLDGKPFWGSLQLDEVAFPLILAYRLGVNDKATYENHIRRAADFIVKNGPRTLQERWEEEAGFSPSTIAAEISGLVCAAEIARKNGDEASAIVYLAIADDWARNVERWTATTTGIYADGNYYLRITQNGEPDKGEPIELNNGAGFFDEREIVDAGFLELVRLGIKSPDDPLIEKSVKVIDRIIRVNTPNGEGFYRYNHDGYGEMDDGRRWNWDGKYTGKGRLWALLSGERGQYELALSNFKRSDTRIESKITRGELAFPYRFKAMKRLAAMLKFAGEGLMIPEQIWDKKDTPENIDKQFVPELKPGEGTGSATPLAWSMAQFIRLTANLQAGKNLDTPDVVYNRYVKNGAGGQASFNLSSPTPEDVFKLKAGESFTVKGKAQPNSTVAYLLGEQRAWATVGAEGNFVLTAKMPETETIEFLAIVTPDNSSFVSQNKIGGSPKEKKLSAEIVEKIRNSKHSPLIEGKKAIFIYRGAAQKVQLAGDFTNWNPFGAVLQDVGENTKAAVMEFPLTARLEYKIIADGKWISDPLNPNKLDNGVGDDNSFFTMPGYQSASFEKGNDAFLDNTDFKSEVFNGVRLLQTYVPSECVKNACAVLYLQDGADYIKRANAVQVQQNLVKAGKLKPFIMVFLNPKERTKEYWANDDYAKFLATEVVPTIDAKYNTVKNRDGRAVLGASLGGITSFWVALKYPETFSRIGGQSSSFWVDDERVVKELAKLDAGKTKFRFYLDDGAFEGVDDSRRVNVLLRGRNFPVIYREGETGHNWTSWRDRLADAFIALWQN